MKLDAMKPIIIAFIIIVSLPFGGNAQDNCNHCKHYDHFISEAKRIDVTQKKLDNYRAAIIAARDCACPQKEKEVNKFINDLFRKIEKEKEKAVEAQKEAEAQQEIIREQRKEIEVALEKAKAANKKNKRIIDAMYFYEGEFALAFKNDKYGFINTEGKVVIPYEYDKGEPFNSEIGLAEMGKIDYLAGTSTKYLIDKRQHELRLIKTIDELETITENDSSIALDFSNQNYSNNNINDLNNTISRYSLAPKIKVLLLNNSNLKSLPDFIPTLSQLTFLGLKGNGDLKELPNSISNLKELTGLNLSNTGLSQLPNGIGELSNLKDLDLSGTSVETLPESFKQLTKLEKLILPADLTLIASAPPKNNNKKPLSDERILKGKDSGSGATPADAKDDEEEFGGEVANNTAGSDPNRSPKAEEDVHHLVNENVYGSPQKLHDCITTYSNLKALANLNLSYFQLDSLPESICDLERLERLDLPYGITYIPSCVGSIESLTNLDLSRTHLKEVPSFMENFEDFNIWNCPIYMDTIPEFLIDRMAEMTHLDLSPFTNLKQLPASIDKLQDLEVLNISGTQINTLPESIIQLENLKYLYLYKTGISDSEKEALKKAMPNCNVVLSE